MAAPPEALRGTSGESLPALRRNRAMKTTPRLRVRLGPAKNGWLRVAITVDGVEHLFHASQTPSDFLQELASALDAFLGVGEGVAILHEEPRAMRLSLSARGAEAELRLRAYDDFLAAVRDSGDTTDVLLIAMPARDLGLAVWRALRALEAAREVLLVPQDWAHAFPSKLVTQAGTRLGRPNRPRNDPDRG